MSLWKDVQFSLRTMRKSPRIALTVLATLTLGIGANTAIFSVVNATLLKPLPFHNPGELVELNADLRGLGAHNVGFSVPELDDLRERAGIFSAVSVVWPGPANLTGGDHPERLEFLAVSPNYFSTLGAKPQLGRLIDSRDTANGFADVVVISDDLWHKEFGGERSVIGRRMRLDEGRCRKRDQRDPGGRRDELPKAPQSFLARFSVPPDRRMERLARPASPECGQPSTSICLKITFSGSTKL